MGNGQPQKETVKSSILNSKQSVNSAAQAALKKLNKITVIGRGGFGKVHAS